MNWKTDQLSTATQAEELTTALSEFLKVCEQEGRMPLHALLTAWQFERWPLGLALRHRHPLQGVKLDALWGAAEALFAMIHSCGGDTPCPCAQCRRPSRARQSSALKHSG